MLFLPKIFGRIWSFPGGKSHLSLEFSWWEGFWLQIPFPYQIWGYLTISCGEGDGTHSSTLAWKIPWMEEPGGLQSMGSLRVGHDWATSLSLFTFMHWRRKWQPTPVFLPRESQGRQGLVGCCLWGSHRVGHDWSDLAVAAATISWENLSSWCVLLSTSCELPNLLT